MLKKKILGAKVLDTNGYVQATRLITPTNFESEAADAKRLFNQGTSKPAHQIGDIYNANMVDVIARAVSQDDSHAINALRKEINDIVSNTESSILSKAIVSMQSSTYNKDTNILTQTFVRGDGSTLQYNTDLTSMIDSNDIKNSESTTINYSNGKVSTSVNTIDTNDIKSLFNKQ